MRGRETRQPDAVATHLLLSLPETIFAKEAKTMVDPVVEIT